MLQFLLEAPQSQLLQKEKLDLKNSDAINKKIMDLYHCGRCIKMCFESKWFVKFRDHESNIYLIDCHMVSGCDAFGFGMAVKRFC